MVVCLTLHRIIAAVFSATSPCLLLLFLHPHIISPLPSPSVTELRYGASTSFIVLPLLTQICLCLSHSLVSFSHRRIASPAMLLQWYGAFQRQCVLCVATLLVINNTTCGAGYICGNNGSSVRGNEEIQLKINNKMKESANNRQKNIAKHCSISTMQCSNPPPPCIYSTYYEAI